jgi:hypothetical protein
MIPTIPAGRDPLLLTGKKPFRPFYSPQDMLNLGVFGGSFFGPDRAMKLIPKFTQFMLFSGVPISSYALAIYNQGINYFNVSLDPMNRTFSMPIGLKRMHPFGWFEWYCKYFYGEESKADEHRIKQWVMSINQHWFYIATSAYTGVGNRFTDLTFLPPRRQALLEFGWDPTIDPATWGFQYKF